ncbi:MAG: 1-acyl-sn-glycerol-3-phosphate acyltransferase [Bacteroidales bacterium]|nr:1-acyl-sn-glycerol-3-phosphate acyltransferase [Bacteroidales bacterium]MBS3774373.1 1-acyl-sn-glycerol-3-phosphate acyltransferase [Bacteroidales bacterium]
MGEEKQGLEKIDVKEVFYRKNPKVARLIPGFIYRYLRKIIHEDEINEVLPKISHLSGLEFVREGLRYFDINIKTYGKEHIPREGRYIFVANHPLGGLDGLAFGKEVGDIHPNLQFIVNDILLNLENLKPIFVPVNKHGKQSSEYVRKIEETYRSDAQILNFPAGLCSRKINGKIVDLEWHKSFVNKARTHKRDIIPVHISGRNSNFFYNFAKIREFIGIKNNIEMFLLPHEMFKQQDKNIVITFGKPIPYTMLEKKYRPKEWAEKIKDHVYRLNEDKDREFSPA